MRIKTIVFLSLFLHAGLALYAQNAVWEKMPSPYGIDAKQVMKSGNGKVLIYCNPALHISRLYSAESPYVDWTRYDIPFGISLPIVHLENGALFAATSENILRSLDFGITWDTVRSDNIMSIAAENHLIALYTYRDSIICSTDAGNTWSIHYCGHYSCFRLHAFFIDSLSRINMVQGSLFLRSRDISTPVIQWDTLVNGSESIDAAFRCESDMYVCYDDSAIVRSTDDGKTWNIFVKITDTARANISIRKILKNGDLIGLRRMTYQGRYIDTPIRIRSGSAAWEPINLPSGMPGDGGLYVDTDLFYSYGNRLLRSTDVGHTWTDITGNLQSMSHFTLHPLNNGETILRGGFGIMRSEQQSTLWRQSYLFSKNVCTGPENEIYLLNDNAVIASLDGGETFHNLDIPQVYGSPADIACDTTGSIYLAYNRYDLDYATGIVYASNDHGTTWNVIFHGGSFVYDSRFAKDGTFVILASDSLFWKAPGLGTFASAPAPHSGETNCIPFYIDHENAYYFHNLQSKDAIEVFSLNTLQTKTIMYSNPASRSMYRIVCVTQDENSVFYLSDFYGVYRSNTMEGPWEQFDTGIDTKCAFDLYYSRPERKVYAATPDGIYRTREPVMGIEQLDIPVSVSLSQNYPNPFNRTTTIEYSIPSAARVIIRLYNSTGRLVETLYDADSERGMKSIQFNGESLLPGTYFYTISTPKETHTRYMTILR